MNITHIVRSVEKENLKIKSKFEAWLKVNSVFLAGKS